MLPTWCLIVGLKVMESTSIDWNLPNCKPNKPVPLTDTHRNIALFIQTPIITLLLGRGFEACSSACLEVTLHHDNHHSTTVTLMGKPGSSRVHHTNLVSVQCPSFNLLYWHLCFVLLDIEWNWKLVFCICFLLYLFVSDEVGWQQVTLSVVAVVYSTRQSSIIHYRWRALETLQCYPLVPVGVWALGTLAGTESTVLKSFVYNSVAFVLNLSTPFCVL